MMIFNSKEVKYNLTLSEDEIEVILGVLGATGDIHNTNGLLQVYFSRIKDKLHTQFNDLLPDLPYIMVMNDDDVFLILKDI
jgi:hypothetical protein